MRILDLGCGDNKVEGAVGLDNIALPEVDIVHDLLSFPYPLKDDAFDIIYLRHVIEHFNINQINLVLNECHRILSNHGKLNISVPYAFSIAAFTDPTHKIFFTFNSGKFRDKSHSKSYYKDRVLLWDLLQIDSKVIWYDWKRYRLRKIDLILSAFMNNKIKKALKNTQNPSLADRLVKKYSFQFVEIRWTFRKAI